MKNKFIYETRIGKILIEENGSAITKIDFISNEENLGELKETELLKMAYCQLEEFLHKKRRIFDLPIELKGSEFQKKVWNELKKIPYGEVRSYKDIAKNIGNEKAVRAVGGANNKNPIPIIVPCHRVIGSDGKLVGYAGGLDKKLKLLNIEKM